MEYRVLTFEQIWKPDRQKQHSILSVFFSYPTEIVTKRHSDLFYKPFYFYAFCWKSIDPRGILELVKYSYKLDLL